MVATVNVKQITGAPASKVYNPTSGDATLRFRTIDTYDPLSTDYPCVIPTSGNKYSYWASLCLDLSGTFNKINNIKHKAQTANAWPLGTGGEVRRGNRDAGDHGCPDASYAQAGGTQGDSGYSIEDAINGHAYYKTQTTPTAVVGTSLATIDTTDYTAAGKTKHIVMQVKVGVGATQGTTSTWTLEWQYDEQ